MAERVDFLSPFFVYDLAEQKRVTQKKNALIESAGNSICWM